MGREKTDRLCCFRRLWPNLERYHKLRRGWNLLHWQGLRARRVWWTESRV